MISKYGKYLKDAGFKHPSHDRVGYFYTDVSGRPRTVHPSHKFMIVTYTPNKSETYYISAEEAIREAPRTGDWQVINRITGEVLAEPKYLAGPGGNDGHRHGVIVNRFGDGKTTWTDKGPNHEHTIEDGNILEVEEHIHGWEKIANES